MMSSIFRFESDPRSRPVLICSASDSGTRNPRARSFVISIDPIGKTSSDISASFSNIDRETVSAPISTSPHPTVFCLRVSVAIESPRGDAMISIILIPALLTTRTRSS